MRIGRFPGSVKDTDQSGSHSPIENNAEERGLAKELISFNIPLILYTEYHNFVALHWHWQTI